MSIFTENITVLETTNSQVLYQPSFLTSNESQILYNYFLHNIAWQHDQAKIYGKTIITKREIAWFADKGYDYNYSGTSRIAQEWNSEVLKLKQKLENETGHKFNSCLLNLYHDGSEGMAWHSDDQNHLEPDSPVAIISLGSERFFKLRETKIRDNQRKLILEKGSLLLMLDQTQTHWQHEIPKMTAVKEPRISLTWRRMGISKLRNP
jgi:alkylated DNA repair dioxygenase AlkB